MKNNKGFSKIAIFLIIILILLGIWYYLGKNSNTTPIQNTPTNNQTNTTNSFNWSSVSNSKFAEIVSKDKDLYFIPEEGLKLTQTVDLTGDGIDEAIVSGNGGNSNVSFILMIDKAGNISVAKQKEKEGTTLAVSLVEVGRVNYQGIFKLLPEEHGFYTAYLTATDINKYGCDSGSVNAYVWSSTTRLFEWNQALTTKYTAQVCK